LKMSFFESLGKIKSKNGDNENNGCTKNYFQSKFKKFYRPPRSLIRLDSTIKLMNSAFEQALFKKGCAKS